MSEVVVVEAVRTPFGKRNGGLSTMHSVELLAHGYPAAGLLTHVFSLADYRRAFQAAMDKRRFQSMKVAIDPRRAP